MLPIAVDGWSPFQALTALTIRFIVNTLRPLVPRLVYGGYGLQLWTVAAAAVMTTDIYGHSFNE